MDVKHSVFRFNQAADNLPPRLRDVLKALPDSVKNSVSEIRLRVDKPIMLTCSGQNWFVDSGAQLHNIPGKGFSVGPAELEQIVLGMCSFSLHSHQNEMSKGFISLRGGHRAGICGTAVLQNGKVGAVRDITSINLRIARDIPGAADEIVRRVFSSGPCGALIAGPPSSGKTTILRDLARQLAGGATGRYHKVAVIDERGELGAVHEGIPQNDLGPACDILSGYPKGEGILTAVRTLSPQVIICDEIGGEEDVTGMLDGLRCGVKIVASAHADTMEELLGRRQIIRLLRDGAFAGIIMLRNAEHPCKVREMIWMEALRIENGRYVVHRPILFDDRNTHGVELIGKSANA